jgi:predicted PurR-regulated permease PerM
VTVTLGVSLLLGLSATAVARTLDLPAPAALGFVVGVMSILPHVGLVVGAIPLLLMTVGFRSATMALVLAAVVLVVQALDSILMRSWIARHTVHIGLLVPWVVALLGYAVYGVGGAAYSTIVAVFVLAAVDQVQVAHTVAPAAP